MALLNTRRQARFREAWEIIASSWRRASKGLLDMTICCTTHKRRVGCSSRFRKKTLPSWREISRRPIESEEFWSGRENLCASYYQFTYHHRAGFRIGE